MIRSMGLALAGVPLARELVGDVDVFDGAVLRQDPQRGGVRCELVVRIGEVRGLAVIELEHGVDLDVATSVSTSGTTSS